MGSTRDPRGSGHIEGMLQSLHETHSSTRRTNDDKYNRPNRKITMLRISDYRPYRRTSSTVEGVSKHMGMMFYKKFPPV